MTPMFYFTADEHYGHVGILKHCNRPFADILAMNHALIINHNAIVTPQDITVHGGDFTFLRKPEAADIIRQLNGCHIFIRGNHDSWLPKSTKEIWKKRIDGQYIVVCHYAMRVWSHWHMGAWQLYGHSHGSLTPYKNQLDIGVDNHNYTPLSFQDIRRIMNRWDRNTLNPARECGHRNALPGLTPPAGAATMSPVAARTPRST